MLEKNEFNNPMFDDVFIMATQENTKFERRLSRIRTHSVNFLITPLGVEVRRKKGLG